MRFSIRDLLWLTALISVVMAWGIHEGWLKQTLDSAMFRGPKLVPAEGRVTLRGVPPPLVSIRVHYPDGEVATSVTDQAGRFALTSGGRVGARPGKKLVVTISPLLSTSARRQGSSVMSVPASMYAGFGTPELTVDIPDEGTTFLKIELN